ncbi:ubiquitin fusion degradation protein UFD1-domain-containing protein [Sphaerosporella brunnea]|uniref:Ubiquitin fusion degradation protein 1 n=1 Tax=Sphaerosporella brunnea TaxID=1250544 RepID=A0A5J5F1C7_9PEZI|nr:ubiquitin fusion degradation protein UFD1-domain-containing protein [Sphaerosporella brunnea]
MSGYGIPGGRGGPPRRFDTYFRCYPIAVLDRKELNYGGKIIMPPSALEKLTRLHIAYPMLFELHNGRQQKMTHAGVLEFIAEEGRVYLPHWMMQTLSLEPGDLLQIKSTDLPSGSFIKLQPQSMSFINAISDPKAVLENALRNFSALTKGDKFQFLYNGDVFEIAVLEVKPQNNSGAISCVETDLEVDFAPPLDYVEPVRTPTNTGSSRPGSVVGGGRVTPITQEGSMAKSIGYSVLAATAVANASAFAGNGQKLKEKGSRAGTPQGGKSTNATPPPAAAPVMTTRKAGPQPLRLPSGTLFFGYTIKPVKAGGDKEAEEKKPSMFSSGGGQTLRAAANKKRKGEEIKGKGSKSG